MTRGINQDRRSFLAAVAAAIAGLELTMFGSPKLSGSEIHAVSDRPLSALGKATTWLNSPPLTARGLRGKVVLVNFCTYTCINWLRSLPYVRAWAEKYRDHGLVVVGVHTPEFDFEHDIDNVRQALRAMRVAYPIAVDNDYAIWHAFGNSYWPALYFVDEDGEVQHRQFGEGNYDDAERMIQRLLEGAGSNSFGREMVTVEPWGVEAPAELDNLASPEIYNGSATTENFVSHHPGLVHHTQGYTAPDRLRLNQWALAGDWTLSKQAASLNAPNGKIVCRFHARDLHLVMGPATRGASVRCRVRVDGQLPGLAHGGDVDEPGNAAVTEQRLYQLIRQPGPIIDREFEIEFLDSGVKAFAFTFG